jgi:hypothetical protein
MRGAWLAGMLLVIAVAIVGSEPVAAGFMGGGCGTSCMMQMQGYCPMCNLMMQQQMMPWGMPQPYWWGTGPMMYSNFYAPSPWNYGPRPGVYSSYYPGTGGMFAAKPNLYLNAPKGTKVTVKMSLVEEGANWLASVPAHGADGWKGTLEEKNKIRSTDGALYRYLYTDYRMYGHGFQDTAGFCAPQKRIVETLAMELRKADFTPREIADFIEYWSVKFPQSKRFCVYPQDERQLDSVAKLEITPKPVAVRRVLFMVQVDEGILAQGGPFATEPKQPWKPEPLRVPAAEGGLVVHEWGVGFFSAGK